MHIGRKLLRFFLLVTLVLLKSKSLYSNSLIEPDSTSGDSLVMFVPKYQYEYVPDAPYELIQDRINCISSRIPLVFNDKVNAFIEYFTVRDREYTKMILKRKHLYLPLFEKYLKKYNLPDELKYLAIVESGLNPKAVSRVGAGGLWQFMPATGRLYSLHQDNYIDERMNPEKATEAACKYLKQLYGMFSDWELALASYNAGPGNVRKAIKRSGHKNNFWEVYDNLPRETRSYVPQFVALMYVLNYSQEHNFNLDDEYEYFMDCDTILVNQYINLETLCSQMNFCIEDLQRLNPELKKTSLPEGIRNYSLKVPSDIRTYFASNRTAILDSAGKIGKEEIVEELLVSKPVEVKSTSKTEKIRYKVRRGDVLGQIADRHNVSVTEIRKWNKLRGNTIKVGQYLTIHKKGTSPAHTNSINNQIVQTKEPVSISPKIHFVQPGDSLWKISKKYLISVDKIKKLNNLKNNEIKPGQKLVLS